MILLLVSVMASGFSPVAFAGPTSPVIAELSYLEKVGAKVISREPALGLGYSQLTTSQQRRLSELSHEAGRCGGFELLPTEELNPFGGLREIQKKNAAWLGNASPRVRVRAKKPEITAALNELKPENLEQTVRWLSAFPSRFHGQSNPNRHVDELETRVREVLSAYPFPWTAEQITHERTRQRTLRVHLEGKSLPAEILVLGGHLDSISQWGGQAPGADDNASGSANLLEALRVFTTKGQPARSVEFFWYAGEEGGLIGSGEIARQYKRAQKNVVAALQLDMTLFPGAGEFVVGNVTDYTSAWLREYLVSINEMYLGVKLIDDECGYACSDHASWYRQGYPTLMPFEADTRRMNRKIHSSADIVDREVSFRHSLVFAKIALILAMDLANSDERQPY